MIDFRDKFIVASTKEPLEKGEEINNFSEHNPRVTIMPSFQLLDGIWDQFDASMEDAAEGFSVESIVGTKLQAARAQMARRAMLLHTAVTRNISAFISSDDPTRRSESYVPQVPKYVAFPLKNLTVFSKSTYGGQLEVRSTYQLGAK